MTCREYRERHPDPGPASRAHEEACAECRAFAACWDLLREEPGLVPSPGFLRGVRRKLAPAVLRFLAPLAAAAAALLVATMVFQSTPSVRITEEERELVENLELLENLDVLRTFEAVDGPSSPILEERR